MMDYLGFAKISGIGLVAIAFLGLGIKTYTPLPDESPAWINIDTQTYISLKCANEDTYEAEFVREPEELKAFRELVGGGHYSIFQTTLGEARASYKPDSACKNSNGFIARESNLTFYAIAAIFNN